MSRRPEGAQVPVPGPFVPLVGSSLLLVAPVCSPRFGPLRLSCSPGVAGSAVWSARASAAGGGRRAARACTPVVCGRVAAGSFKFRHLHLGDRSRVVSC
jgi:hypothetical protein